MDALEYEAMYERLVKKFAKANAETARQHQDFDRMYNRMREEKSRAEKAEQELAVMRRAWELHDLHRRIYESLWYIDRARAELDGQKGNYKPTPDSVGTTATCGEGIIFEEWEKKSNVEIDGQKGKDDAYLAPVWDLVDAVSSGLGDDDPVFGPLIAAVRRDVLGEKI